MPEKVKAMINVAGYITFIVFGIANIFAGVYLWGVQPTLAIAVFAASLACIVRGAAELLEYVPAKGKR